MANINVHGHGSKDTLEAKVSRLGGESKGTVTLTLRLGGDEVTLYFHDGDADPGEIISEAFRSWQMSESEEASRFSFLGLDELELSSLIGSLYPLGEDGHRECRHWLYERSASGRVLALSVWAYDGTLLSSIC